MGSRPFSFAFLNGIFAEGSGSGLSSSSSFFGVEPIGPPQPAFSVLEMVKAIQNPGTRERALHLLSTYKDSHGYHLAPLLWRTNGTIDVLLQMISSFHAVRQAFGFDISILVLKAPFEVAATYHLLSTPQLTDRVITRLCNALSLLQKVASHPETRLQFMRADIPKYLYPFLNITERDKAHEDLRLTSLIVIVSMLKDDSNNEVVLFLLRSEVLPYILRCMNVGAELSKTVAVFIIHRILQNRKGQKYICTVAERSFAVAKTLTRILDELPVHISSKTLLMHIISCYATFSENSRPCDGVVACFPKRLVDGTFYHIMNDDPVANVQLKKLVQNIQGGSRAKTYPAEDAVARLIGR